MNDVSQQILPSIERPLQFLRLTAPVDGTVFPAEQKTSWYGVEGAGTASFRWTRETEIAWRVQARPFQSCDLIIVIPIQDEIQPAFANNCRLQVGRQNVPLVRDGAVLTASLSIEEPVDSVVKLLMPPLLRPCDLKPVADSRPLGLAIPTGPTVDRRYPKSAEGRIVWNDPWAAEFRSHVPFAVVVPTVYGPMILHRFDDHQGTPGFRAGKAMAHREIRLLSRVLQSLGTDTVFVDIGANVGYFSIALAKVVGPMGKVHAFEPQRIIFNMLAGSVALNTLMNVYCYNMALGEHEGKVEIPQFDYFRSMSFGSIEFGPEQKEKLSQERGHDPARQEYVPLITLDHFEFSRIDVLKIDAEGMEMGIFHGGKETITRCRPVIFVEFLKSNKDSMRNYLIEMGYTIADAGGFNYLAIPTERVAQLPLLAEFLLNLD
jgi:FkbM family methyltransferase